MRCPACGARNAGSADWCTLCYAPLRTEPPVEEPPPSADDPAAMPSEMTAPAARQPPSDDAVPQPDVAAPGESAPAATRDGRFRRTAEGLDWRCAACETWNPIERQTCASCAAPFARTLAPEGGAPPPAVNETTAVAASLLLPGAGHVLMGRTAAGALRSILYVTWLVGGIALLRAAAGSGQSVLSALPLLAGALVVLVASVVEAQRTVSGNETVLLTPRITLWLVVIVLGALMVAFLAAAMSVTP